MAKKKAKRQNNAKKSLQKSANSLNGARVNKNQNNYDTQKIKKFDLDTLDEILEETEKLDLTNLSELNDIDKDDTLDLTNVSEITFDDIRLMDEDSLDTSFLEGRHKKPIIENSVEEEKKEEKQNSRISKNKDINLKSNKTRFNNDNNKKEKKSGSIFKFIIIIILSLIVGFCICVFCFKTIFVEKKVVKEVEEKVVTKIDDNYLFLGDSITELYDLNKYYENLPVVNSGISGNTTEDILDNMKDRVYKYNPSKVFILIGTNDYIHDGDNDSIIKNIQKIIKEIQANRPYCEIYLESIYPVNDSDEDKIDHDMVDERNNEDIRKANEELKEIANTLKVTYIDMYSLLQDDEENLKLDYTKEGLHINDEGYKVITKEIKKYLK